MLKEMCDRTDSMTLIANPLSSTDIVFKTDHSITDLGFNLTYSSSPCGGVFSGPTERIFSPRAPGSQNYPNNIDCVWLLKFDEGQQIQVEFMSEFLNLSFMVFSLC